MTFVQHEFSASDLLSLDPATRRLRSQSANAIFAARVLCVPLAGLTSCHVGMLGLGPEEESALAARESLYAGSHTFLQMDIRSLKLSQVLVTFQGQADGVFCSHGFL